TSIVGTPHAVGTSQSPRHVDCFWNLSKELFSLAMRLYCSLSVIKNADLPCRFAQQARDAECHVREEYDFNARVSFPQCVEIRPVEQVAFDVGFCHHHRRARSLVEHAHLTEGHSGREHAEPLLSTAREFESDDRGTSIEKKDLAGFRAHLDQDFVPTIAPVL